MEALKKLQSSDGRKEFLRTQKFNIIVYFVACVCMFFVYHFFSDGDFSFLLTLGGAIRLLGFGILLMRVMKDKSAQGLSIKTQILYALVFVGRCCSVFFYEGYKPFDKSGDWVFQYVELVSFLVVAAIIGTSLGMYKATYSLDDDAFGRFLKIPHQYGGILVIAGPCLLMALIVHPSLNKNFFTDVSWTFAMYLETFAVLPQLYLFQKANKPVEPWTSHFVFSLGLSRFMFLAFWASSYHELSDSKSSSLTGGWVGILVLLVNIIHALFMLDYCYYYLRSAKQNTPLTVPGLQV